MANETGLDDRSVRRAFERAAGRYDELGVLQKEIGSRLFARLEYIKLQPRSVLDLGAGTGYFTAELMRRYKKSQVVAADFALPMLHQAGKRRAGLFRKPGLVCADAGSLPFTDESFDLVFSNLMLQWCQPIEKYFAELRRVIRPDGLLLFSSFGPDTLQELRQAWREADDAVHVHEFQDMHDVGDALLQAGFAEPVMDMEMLTLTYRQLKDLLLDLKGVGAAYAAADRSRGLLGKQRYAAMEAAYERFRNQESRLPASYEVVYGHAWAPPVSASVLPEKTFQIKPEN
ncbi:MAG TPA: malonyl-[acyl-carrier protein] O-methyltransferase BioC [Chromatiales bacterium]|nr:malonyl-ACP O-methyltransferase BioC [Thiotrichales bacterium]HIP68789.1 malonyl-[acyl-carrier protein] O-methyltransferase BioC [Chromatiales bacterium]